MYQEILAGDELAIQELWDYLYKFSWHEWPDNKTVSLFREDFVNESVWKILDNLHSFRGESKFTTWATTIFKNFVLDKVRLQHNQATYNNEEIDGVLKLNDYPILVDELFHLVVPKVISEADFHMLVDYLALGRTISEVCSDYGIPNPNALYVRIFRTKAAIIKAVGVDFLS